MNTIIDYNKIYKYSTSIPFRLGKFFQDMDGDVYLVVGFSKRKVYEKFTKSIKGLLSIDEATKLASSEPFIFMGNQTEDLKPIWDKASSIKEIDVRQYMREHNDEIQQTYSDSLNDFNATVWRRSTRKRLLKGKLSKTNDDYILLNQVTKGELPISVLSSIQDQYSTEAAQGFVDNLLREKRFYGGLMGSLSEIYSDWFLTYGILNSELSKATDEITNARKKDAEKAKNDAETNRMGRMSTGIHDHDEVNIMTMMDQFIFKDSENTKKALSKQKVFYEQIMVGGYMKLELLLYVPLNIKNPDATNTLWRIKVDAFKSFIGEKTFEEHHFKEKLDSIRKMSNFYKHQKMLDRDYDPMTPKQINKLIRDIYLVLGEQLNFKKLIDEIDSIYYEWDSIVDPFGDAKYGL